jgi:hypothetical protein
MSNPHTQYLAANSEELESWINQHHSQGGHDLELLKDEIGAAKGYRDVITGEEVFIKWR